MTGRISLDLNIRRVRRDEMERLRDISVTTFTDTYAQHNTPENMSSYMAKSFDPTRLRAELAADDTHYYFAERDAEVLGYLKLNFRSAQTNSSLQQSCEIERIYVVRKYQGQKIGKLLFDHAMRRAQNAKLTWLWLGVWDQNTKAIGFYKNMGFEVFASHDFTLGTEEQTDYLMRIRIQAS